VLDAVLEVEHARHALVVPQRRAHQRLHAPHDHAFRLVQHVVLRDVFGEKRHAFGHHAMRDRPADRQRPGS
jgi:hypothetical protein